MEIIDEKRVLIDFIRKKRWKMVEHTLRELHSKMGTVKGKRPPGGHFNIFIGQIKKDAGVGNYRALKKNGE